MSRNGSAGRAELQVPGSCSMVEAAGVEPVDADKSKHLFISALGLYLLSLYSRECTHDGVR